MNHSRSRVTNAAMVNRMGSRTRGGVKSTLFDFTKPTLDPRITFTRASAAWGFNQAGVLTSFPVNTPRLDFDPTNILGQNFFLWSEDVSQAQWSKQSGALGAQIAAPDGTVTAYPFIPDNTSNIHRIFSTFALTLGQPFTLSMYVKNTGVRYIYLNAVSGLNAAAVFDLTTVTFANRGGTSTTGTFITDAGNGWYRVGFTGFGTGNVGVPVYVQANSTFVSTDSTYTGDNVSGFATWGIQANVGSTALPYAKTAGAVVTNCAPRGLLVEPTRINTIRNASTAGVIAGTPGTLPNNWSLSNFSNNGLTTTIVGFGSDNGIPYMDFDISGTSTGGITCAIFFEGIAVVPSAINGVWVGSAYVKLLSGVTPLGMGIAIKERDSAGNFVVDQIQAINPTTGILAANRQVISKTLTGSNTAFVTLGLQFVPTTGTAYAVRYRIGLPVLESGAVGAGSPIITTAGAVTVSPDICYVAAGSGFIFDRPYGTIYVEAELPVNTKAAAQGIIEIDDSTGTTRTTISHELNGKVGGATVYSAIASALSTIVAPTTPMRIAFGYNSGGLALQVTGDTLQKVAGPITLPTSLGTYFRFGNRYNGTFGVGGWIKKVRHITRKVSDAEMAQMFV